MMHSLTNTFSDDLAKPFRCNLYSCSSGFSCRARGRSGLLQRSSCVNKTERLDSTKDGSFEIA